MSTSAGRAGAADPRRAGALIACVLLGACSQIGPTMPAQRSESAPASTGVSRSQASFRALADEIGKELLASSPLAAAAGGRPASDAWDDLGEAAQAARRAYLEASLRRLATEFAPQALDTRTRLQYQVLEDELESRLAWQHSWRNHVYPLNQIVGLHLQVPDTLIERHGIASIADAQAYIRRTERVPALFDALLAQMKRQEAARVLMPRSTYSHLIGGARSIISGEPFGRGADSPIWADFKRKVAALEISDAEEARLLEAASSALRQHFGPAYEALLERLVYEQGVTRIDGGVWQLPDGERFYRFAVRLFTTSDLSPDDVHQIGLAHIERLQGEIRGIMKRVDFAGTLDEFFEHSRNDPRFFHADTDTGRNAYLAKARAQVAAIAARVDEILATAPDVPIEVRRFPSYREPSAPRGFYQPAPREGGAAGVVYLNLANMQSNPTHGLDALLYHEGIPGHHLQISAINANDRLPLLRRASTWWLYGAFVEGWALYAEQFAKEMGLYADPYADFGRLAAKLWRAGRLVVDTGLHWKRWTREQAIDYLLENTPGTLETSTQEVDRYLIVPGQATGFMIGMQRILEIRGAAETALGASFDVREFHDVVLSQGFVPLWAVECAVEEWVETKRAAR